MANPNNAVGTNGAFGGRTSVNAFNDVLSAFSGRGILSGWACSPSSGLTVQLGGDGETRDVAIAEDASGNKTTVNNISQSPVEITIPSAPASNSRIDLVVAYIEDSPNGSGETDNYDVVNLLVVSGAVSSAPVAPNDSAIRTAITADGASGATAYYVVLAEITIPTGTTDIDSTMISAGTNATLLASKIGTGSVTADMIDFTTFKYPNSAEIIVGEWVDGSKIYRKHFSGTFTTSTGSSLSIPLINSGIKMVIQVVGGYSTNDTIPNVNINTPYLSITGGVTFDSAVSVRTTSTGALNLVVGSNQYDGQTGSYDIVVDYIKSV